MAAGKLADVRRCFFLCLFCALTAAAFPAVAASARVLKVLPQFLDLNGKHTLSPSLFERDAYQAILREHPERRSGLRFDVWWKARGPARAPLKLRLELRGTANGQLPTQMVLETEVKPGFFSHWVSLPMTGEEFRKFGEVTAWRATISEDGAQLDEQKSFLW
jgi:hypothetical protein